MSGKKRTNETRLSEPSVLIRRGRVQGLTARRCYMLLVLQKGGITDLTDLAELTGLTEDTISKAALQLLHDKAERYLDSLHIPELQYTHEQLRGQVHCLICGLTSYLSPCVRCGLKGRYRLYKPRVVNPVNLPDACTYLGPEEE